MKPRTAPDSDAGCAPIALGALADDVGFLVRRAQVWIFQDFSRTLADCKIRPAQYSVLTVIAANPGLSQMALSKALGIERAHLMHMLDAMEAGDLIARAPSSRDRRSHELYLTPAGQALLKKIRKLIARHEANVADKMGPENRIALLRALVAFR